LSESVTTTETVEIPGELKLNNPITPPVTVRLPIVARPRGLMNTLLGLLALPMGVLLCGPFVALVFGADDISSSVLDGILLVALPLSLLGVAFAGAALTCFWDAARSDPVLEISVNGLHDRRSGLSVPWSSVRCARILSDRSVDLQLRGPVTNWQNPFRVGVLFHRYRPKPDHVIISVGYLHVRAHILAYTILTLTQWNGGEAISKTPGAAFDMGLKVIPRKRA
jgi:hypothetical protein